MIYYSKFFSSSMIHTAQALLSPDCPPTRNPHDRLVRRRGVGGCPYSPGATGNVATEDVLYALQSPYHVVGSSSGNTINLEICEIGSWISGMLGRTTVSHVGKAMLVCRQSSKL